MSDEKRKPLVLVVEDDDEFRNDIIGAELTKLDVRVIEAENVRAGLLRAAEHDFDSGDALDLVILDMHMPLDERTLDVDPGGGIRTLIACSQYGCASQCPVIIFTAHPSYADCLNAAKLGISAYIPKARTEDGEGGIDQLLATCDSLLFGPEPALAEPTSEWFKQNSTWFHDTFAGKWVAFVREAAAKAAGLDVNDPTRFREGIYVLSGAKRNDVRNQIIENTAILKDFPPIAKVEDANGNRPDERDA